MCVDKAREDGPTTEIQSLGMLVTQRKDFRIGADGQNTIAVGGYSGGEW
jgi:hypothetical protein